MPQIIAPHMAEAAATATVRPTEGPVCRAARAAFLIFHSMEPTNPTTPRIPIWIQTSR